MTPVRARSRAANQRPTVLGRVWLAVSLSACCETMGGTSPVIQSMKSEGVAVGWSVMVDVSWLAQWLLHRRAADRVRRSILCLYSTSLLLHMLL